MPESIKVFYERLGEIAGKTYYHETLLYTDAAGNQSIASCFPTGELPEGITASETSQVIAQAATGAVTDFGTLKCVAGSVNDSTIQGQLDVGRLVGPGVPSETVAMSDDAGGLSNAWSIITQAEAQITASGLNYSPLTLNSNSAVGTALLAANINPYALGNGVFGYWSPAAANILSTAFTPPSNGTNVAPSADGVKVTEIDSAGNMASVDIDSSAGATTVVGQLAGHGSPTFVATENFDNGTTYETVTGSAGAINIDNAVVTFDNGTSATLVGNYNYVTVGQGSQIILGGWVNTLFEGSSDSVSTYGGWNSIYANPSSSTTINDTGGGTNSVFGNGVLWNYGGSPTGIYVTDNANVNFYGTGSEVLIQGNNSLVTSYGDHDLVSESGSYDEIALQSTNSLGAAVGIADRVDGMADYSTIWMQGDYDVGTLYGDYGSIYAWGPDESMNLEGSGDYGYWEPPGGGDGGGGWGWYDAKVPVGGSDVVSGERGVVARRVLQEDRGGSGAVTSSSGSYSPTQLASDMASAPSLDASLQLTQAMAGFVLNHPPVTVISRFDSSHVVRESLILSAAS